jgi:hypothetical protein
MSEAQIWMTALFLALVMVLVILSSQVILPD